MAIGEGATQIMPHGVADRQESLQHTAHYYFNVEISNQENLQHAADSYFKVDVRSGIVSGVSVSVSDFGFLAKLRSRGLVRLPLYNYPCVSHTCSLPCARCSGNSSAWLQSLSVLAVLQASEARKQIFDKMRRGSRREESQIDKDVLLGLMQEEMQERAEGEP